VDGRAGGRPREIVGDYIDGLTATIPRRVESYPRRTKAGAVTPAPVPHPAFESHG